MEKLKNQPGLFDAINARNEALKQVEDNSCDWFSLAMALIPKLPRNGPFMGEDLRHAITERIGPPHSVNAFGALVAQAKRKSLIVETGQWLKPKDVKSHASRKPEYRWPE